jgi:hypothetical protein
LSTHPPSKLGTFPSKFPRDARIDAAELPVTHVTRRQGRPYTLVLNKTGATPPPETSLEM